MPDENKKRAELSPEEREELDRNLPTHRAMEQGLFEVKETTIANPDGSIRVTKTTKVTGKGQVYFVNRYLKEA